MLTAWQNRAENPGPDVHAGLTQASRVGSLGIVMPEDPAGGHDQGRGVAEAGDWRRRIDLAPIGRQRLSGPLGSGGAL